MTGKATEKQAEGDTLGMRFFTAFCNHWNCTSLQPLHLWWFSHCFATIDNFCLVFLQWLNEPKIQKTKNQEQKRWQDPTLCHYSPLGVCNLVFFAFCFLFLVFLICWFLGFLFSGSSLVFLQWLNETKIQKNKKQETRKKWQDPALCHYSPPWSVQYCFVFLFFLVSWFFSFLVFWFVAGFLEGWQNNTKVKDLDLTLCQFSHYRGCKLAFGWSYWLLWACGSIGEPPKKDGKMQVWLEEAWGAWNTD